MPLSPQRKIQRDSLIRRYRGGLVHLPRPPRVTFRTRDALSEPTTDIRTGRRGAALRPSQSLRNRVGVRTRAGSDSFHLPDRRPHASLRPKPTPAIPFAAPYDRADHPDLLPKCHSPSTDPPA